MKSGDKDQYADGSFMRIEVVSMLKLVFMASLGIMLLSLFVIIGFSSAPDATNSDWTSQRRRCISDFSQDLYQTCSDDNSTISTSDLNDSVVAVNRALNLPTSERDIVLACMFDACANATNKPFASTAKSPSVVQYSFGVHGMRQRSRYFYLEAVFNNQKPNADDHSFQVTMTPRVRGIYEDTASGNDTFASLGLHTTPLTATVLCYKSEYACDPLYFSLLHDIYFDDYVVDVLFNSTEGLPLAGTSIQFRKTWGTLAFTNWMIGMKLFFLFVSAGVAAWYLTQVNSLTQREHNIEQGWVASLAISLVLFNDPFYVAEVSFGSTPARILSVGFQVTFLMLLLLYWLMSIDNMRLQGKENGVSNMRFFKPKVTFVSYFWMMMVLYFGYIKFESTDGGAAYDPLATNSSYALITAICAALSVFYVLWLIYLVAASVDQLRALRLRYRYLVLLNASMTAFFFIGLATGCYSPAPPTSGQWTSVITIFNLYVYTLCYLYGPSASALAASKTHKEQQIADKHHDLEASPTFLAPVLPSSSDEVAKATTATQVAEPTPIDLPDIDVREDLDLA